MKKVFHEDLSKDKSYSIEGTKILSIKRKEEVDENGVGCSTIEIKTDKEHHKYWVPVKGSWCLLVNRVTRKPMGFYLKHKQKMATVKIFIVA